MLNDEIIDEVRAIRDAHAAMFGYDLQAVIPSFPRHRNFLHLTRHCSGLASLAAQFVVSWKTDFK
ncbi:hypothetical protein D5125_13460 [Magnetovirga frankeli]|uniref:hypothetical protein n=1 Tax=Magnetovirga frankeli TaxID=947516 RepID=UPI0012934941|nr:hypothetical protein D5125_13460 [gamma proteobacterium SS-5]